MADAAGAEEFSQVAGAERQYIVDGEAGECIVGDFFVAGEVRCTGAECVEAVLGREGAGEASGADGGVDIEDVVVWLWDEGDLLVGWAGDGAGHGAGGGDAAARSGANHGRAAVAGREREVAVPGNELFALAVAADPFEFAALGPFDRGDRGRREFDGGVREAEQQLIDARAVGLAPFERRGAAAGGTTVGIDVPGVDAVEVKVGNIDTSHVRIRVDAGQVGSDGVVVDADCSAAGGEEA